jgi:hypothetical protein
MDYGSDYGNLCADKPPPVAPHYPSIQNQRAGIEGLLLKWIT